MRVKKQKQLRRHVSFYKTCFGFREPYKVLCDGTFVHYNLTQRLGALQDSLSTILGGPAKPLVTRCVIAELKKLGEAYSGSALAARRLDLIKCEHEPFLPAAECAASLVGSHNEEHYFVATQDLDLRKRLRKVHGGALIYANNTSLVLEPPSDTQKQYAKMGELERNRLSEREKHLLKLRQEKLLSQKKEEEEKGDAEKDGVKVNGDGTSLPVGQKMKNAKRNQNPNPLGVTERPVFKRKRVKGPNPLSCKKKKTKTGKQKSTDQMSTGTEGQEKKKKNQRHRRKKESENKGAERSDASAAS